MIEGLKRTFGIAPEHYHRARPRYPVDLVRCVAEGVSATPRIVEIGCGSGHATTAFVEGASEYVAIDISAELIAIAERELGRHPHLRFMVGAFEDVSLPRAGFDLLIAGQSFHWIDPDVGLRKANDVLVEGGRIALFWSFVRFDGLEFLREARSIILRHVMSFERWPDSSDARYESYGAEWSRALDETGFFAPASVSSFDGSVTHSQATFLDWVGSLSWFRILSDSEKQSLLDELRELRAHDDTFDVPVRSLLVRADKPLG